jgi:hypothetical protein
VGSRRRLRRILRHGLPQQADSVFVTRRPVFRFTIRDIRPADIDKTQSSQRRTANQR